MGVAILRFEDVNENYVINRGVQNSRQYSGAEVSSLRRAKPSIRGGRDESPAESSIAIE
jgi:hypothetical protein